MAPYMNPIKVSEPHNILHPDDYRCKECGESRVNYLEVSVVVNSTQCTIYQINCSVCSKLNLVEVVSAKIQKQLERLENMDADGETIHQVQFSPVRSALTGQLIEPPDRKSQAAGERN